MLTRCPTDSYVGAAWSGSGAHGTASGGRLAYRFDRSWRWAWGCYYSASKTRWHNFCPRGSRATSGSESMMVHLPNLLRRHPLQSAKKVDYFLRAACWPSQQHCRPGWTSRELQNMAVAKTATPFRFCPEHSPLNFRINRLWNLKATNPLRDATSSVSLLIYLLGRLTALHCSDSKLKKDQDTQGFVELSALRD